MTLFFLNSNMTLLIFSFENCTFEKNRNIMETMDKLSALNYITQNKPVCDNCLRGNLEQIRMAAGLYQLVKDIVGGNQDIFLQKDIDVKIKLATTF